MIRAEHLTKAFGPILAVDDLTFSVPQGSLFGLMGPDGSGKSTTLKLLSGVLAPTSGSAWVAGYQTVKEADQVRSVARHMSQGFDLYPDLTVQENLDFFADILGLDDSKRKDRIEELLAFTHLKPFKDRIANRLSGGMKQKLALAVALVYTPQVLFLDEPTNGVDPVSRRDFWRVLHKLLKQGVTLFVTTTYVEEAERCDQVGLLEQGRLLAIGPLTELKNRFRLSLAPGLRKPYGHPIPKESAISAQHLVKRFDNFVAVDQISFDIPKGSIFGFIGPNGAGKSTTIRMLCGIMPPTSGEGFVAGFDIYRQSEQIKANIGYMSQKFSLYADLTVEENIDFYNGIYLVPSGKKQQRKDWVLEMSGLKDQKHLLAGDLSGGWKQHLALGCAVLHEPPILFLDEPTSGVDATSRQTFWNLIYQLSESGVTIFVTTHYMEEAEYVDTIAFIFGGRIIATGTPDALKRNTPRSGMASPTLEDVFISLIESHENGTTG